MSLCHLHFGTLGIFQLEGIRVKGLAGLPTTQGQQLDHRGFSGAGRGTQHHPAGPAKTFSVVYSKVLHSSGLVQKNARLWHLGKKENRKELMTARLGWALVWISQGWDIEVTSTNPRVLLWEA